MERSWFRCHYNKNEAKIEILHVPDRPGIAAKLFKPIADAKSSVDMIVQTSSTTTGFADSAFTVAKATSPSAEDHPEKYEDPWGREVIFG